MLINANQTQNHIKFISYSGKYPGLRFGTLVLDIDGKEVKFGYRCKDSQADYSTFWSSGRSCGFTGGYKP